MSSLLPNVDLEPLQRFRWRLLKHYVKADNPLNKEHCLECCGVLYTHMNRPISVRKNSSPNEFFYDFQLNSVKKKDTHGLKHVVGEY